MQNFTFIRRCKKLRYQNKSEGVTVKKKIKDNETENTVHNIEESSEIGEKELREKRLKRRKRQRFWDRVAGFIIVTGLVVGCACLTLE